eukprot:SAG11_NODE_1255_length_5375_cov_2.966641_2_plen_80_part_00
MRQEDSHDAEAASALDEAAALLSPSFSTPVAPQPEAEEAGEEGPAASKQEPPVILPDFCGAVQCEVGACVSGLARCAVG